MNTANTAIIQRVYECWNKRDFSVIPELFPDSIYHSSVTGELRGEVYGKYFIALLNAFPDGRLTVNDQITQDDKVAVRWQFTGTHKGELMGLAPTGKQVTMTGISIIRIVNAKIAEVWEEWDNLGMMQQLGVVPAVKLGAKVAA